MSNNSNELARAGADTETSLSAGLLLGHNRQTFIFPERERERERESNFKDIKRQCAITVMN